MSLPLDYAERVYAGVLGKIIGVYLGRPFEGATYDQIMSGLGEINYYVHTRRNVPLVVADDDIAGTFTFIRALEDTAAGRTLTPKQIGETWLNYLIEQQSVLWWGGLGNSTEHTAYLRLKHGIPAPQSGSIAVNGQIVAEQIGAQIFIDGWAMVAPGDPELAVDLARKAGSVSHDGEALYGAMALAAMESMAFVETNIDALLDTALRFIPKNSVIYRLINDLREWHAEYPDWHTTREQIVAHYGYDKFGHNCHMVPNHALIHLGLLYGKGDFQKSLMICNTAGWDTDCNSGNLGCLLGIRGGLQGLDQGPDWRGPVADRLYIPTADGGRTVSDAALEAQHLINMGRALAGEKPLTLKNSARFHFEFPGSVQGFTPEESDETHGTLTLSNVTGHSQDGTRSLALHYQHLAHQRFARASTPTFLPPEVLSSQQGYRLEASPTLYPGQMVRAHIEADSANRMPVTVQLYVQFYNSSDKPERRYGPGIVLPAGQSHRLQWKVDDLGGYPICTVGLEISSETFAEGTLYLDSLTWDGAPEVSLTRPAQGGFFWRKGWVSSVNDLVQSVPMRLIQNEGRGIIIQGTREWQDYQVSAKVNPFMVKVTGVAARVQGLRRYYALLLTEGNKLRLVKYLDTETTLAETAFSWNNQSWYTLTLQVSGSRIQAWVDGKLVFDLEDTPALNGAMPLTSGAIGLVCEEGLVFVETVTVKGSLT